MKYFYTIFLLSLISFGSRAQNYPVSEIPKELLSHASAVIRENETTVEVKSLDAVTEHVKYAVTVLNKNGDGQAQLVLWHDKAKHIKSVKGGIYNEFGLLTTKINESSFTEHNYDDGSLFYDTQYKMCKPAVTVYPYTVAFEYEISHKQSLMLPDWDPNSSVSVSVEHSSYKITSKADFGIRYKEFNFPGKVEVSEAAGLKTYSWTISNIKAHRDEPFSPDDEKLITSVKIAPVNFAYENFSGSFTNWNEFGKWMYDKLLKDRQTLPQNTVEHIKEMTANITDPKEKAKVIYQYMQHKTRYVSVQIGIGGWQPFLASDVDNLSYGDCKALVNYTKSLLSAAGINSYYSIVKSGDDKISAKPDFASMNQFDHVILCLPFKNDTTWLECTSQQIPFGFLGEFTDDRTVLACTPDGGKLMHTPVYTTTDNKQTRKGVFTLAANGELSGEMVTRFEGIQYDNRDYLVNEAPKEQVKMLKETYPIENLEIKSFDLKQDKAIKPVTTETIKLEARDYMAPNGDRFFFIPDMANRNTHTIKDVSNRVNPVYINRGYLDVDEITYTLPEGFKVSGGEKFNITIDKPFGRYHASTQLINNTLVYKRSLQLNDGTYPKDMYADLVDFYESVAHADNYTLTMEKK